MNKTLLLAALVSASAFAQETPPPPPAAPAPAVAADAPAPEAADPGGRVRWGIGAGLGVLVPNFAVTFGAEGRIGYQVSNMFSAYAILGATAGLGFTAANTVTGASGGITAIGYWYVGGVAEFMFGDLFYVGAGPVLASGGWAGLSVGVDSAGNATSTALAAGGFMPGLDIRLGLGFGKAKPGSPRRGGFNLGLDVLTLIAPNAVYTTVTAGQGGANASVTTNGLAVGIVPMLTLGYESR